MSRRVMCAIGVVVLLLGTLSGWAGAEENESFGIAPFPQQVDGIDRGTFGVPLEVGATFEDSVRVYNRTDQQIELAIYPADARAGVDGAISVGFRGSRPEGVGGWIDLTQDSVTLLPRDEAIVPFRITVQSAAPSPDIGAIVVEDTARGLSADLAQRVRVVVRTLPPGSPTTSQRSRGFLLRSPWIVVALLGLVVAAFLVWLGARRARRPRDAISPPGELAKPDEDRVPAPQASRPILHRLGARRSETKEPPPSTKTVRTRTRQDDATEVITDAPLDTTDERPLLDLVPDDEDRSEEKPPPPRAEPVRTKPPPAVAEPEPARTEDVIKTNSKKLNYIPLDDL